MLAAIQIVMVILFHILTRVDLVLLELQGEGEGGGYLVFADGHTMKLGQLSGLWSAIYSDEGARLVVNGEYHHWNAWGGPWRKQGAAEYYRGSQSEHK